MKSINQILRQDPSLIDNPVVQELVEYTRELEGEIIEANQSTRFSFETKLSVLVNELYSDIGTLFESEEESKRFNEIPTPDFREALVNLKKYFDNFSVDNNYNFNKIR